MQKKAFHRSLRRSTALLSAVLILFTCSRLLVADTWAWFSSNSTAASGQIRAGTWDASITVTTPDGHNLNPADGNTYVLAPGLPYTVELEPAAASTVSSGYVALTSDGEFAAVTRDMARAGLSFTLIPGPFDGTEFTFQPVWGVYDDSAAPFGPGRILLIQDGDIIGQLPPEDPTEPSEPVETDPAETEPAETEPVETKPVETEPAETEPVETDPAETEPVETKPVETEPAETEPVETEPVETEPAETEPVETEPVETDPVETEPVETDPVETMPPEPQQQVVQNSGASFSASSFAAKFAAYQANYDKLFEDSMDMPMYFQDDYPNVRYGAGSVATSGCGIVSLAMVASYLTDHDYQPDQLARWFGGRAINNMARMETAATALRLPWTKAENIHESEAALAEGKIVIALMEGYSGSCPFTQSQHFIVLKGLNEEGRILVNDPYKPNYEKWDLKEGFAYGFDRSAILSGYSGGWIFDPEEMPDKPFIYHQEDGLNYENYPDVDLTFEEQELIAKVIWVEAQGECAEGQQAVAEVILNRLVSGRFGSSVESVIYAEGQFRSVPKIPEATPWQAQYDALDRALYGESVLDPYVYYFATAPTTSNVWGKIGGHIFCYDE